MGVGKKYLADIRNAYHSLWDFIDDMGRAKSEHVVFFDSKLLSLEKQN